MESCLFLFFILAFDQTVLFSLLLPQGLRVPKGLFFSFSSEESAIDKQFHFSN